MESFYSLRGSILGSCQCQGGWFLALNLRFSERPWEFKMADRHVGPPCDTILYCQKRRKSKSDWIRLGDILWQWQLWEHGEKCVVVKYLAPEKVDNSTSCDIYNRRNSLDVVLCLYFMLYPPRLPPWPWLPGSSAPPPPSRSQRWTTWVMTTLVIKVNWL